MKTIHAQAALRVDRESVPALQEVPATPVPAPESLAERIQRLVAEANAMPVLPGSLHALSPVHPASELFLNLCAPERVIDPPVRR